MAKAKELDRDALLKKITAIRRKFVAAVGEAKSANLVTGAAKKKKIDSLIEEAVKLGIPRKAFKQHMKQLDHTDAVVSDRNQVADNEDVLHSLDKLIELTEAALPLFSDSAQEEIRANAKKPIGDEPAEDDKEPEDDDENVSRFPSREGASAA